MGGATKSFATAAAVFFLLHGSAWAHGGGLNSDGCHNETRTGGYHCHRGGSGGLTAEESAITWGVVGGLAVVLLGFWIWVELRDDDERALGVQRTPRHIPNLQTRVTDDGAWVGWRLDF